MYTPNDYKRRLKRDHSSHSSTFMRSIRVFSYSMWGALLMWGALGCESPPLASSSDLCEAIECSGHGVCVLLRGDPTCACDEDYQPDEVNGLNCLRSSGTSLLDPSSPFDRGRPAPMDQELWVDRDLGMGGAEGAGTEGGPEGGGTGVSTGGDGAGMMSSGAEVSAGQVSAGGIEVGGAEMAGAEMAGAEMVGAEMAGAEMAGAEMAGAEMAGAEMAGAEGGACSSELPEPTCIAATDSEMMNALCNGYDDDCDGVIDEGCVCKTGEVKPCFSGQVETLEQGACVAGTMRCQTIDGFPQWGACEGEVTASEEICDGLDNNCDGCVDEVTRCNPEISCPGPDDPRTPPTAPFENYLLDGGLFFEGEAQTWSWSVEGGPCDSISFGRSSFELLNPSAQVATFRPLLSGSYRVTLTIVTPEGEEYVCSWVIHVEAPGLRVEMCYPESTYLDLDLLLMRHSTLGPWYLSAFSAFDPTADACSWANCEAELRGFTGLRVNWGYAPSPISACANSPQGFLWSILGVCANPRLDIDNNLVEGVGLPENINVDRPVNDEVYRVMIQNFSGGLAHPMVNIYCGGSLKATFGAPPDQVPQFMGESGAWAVGAMWRVVDVTTFVDAQGNTTECLITPVTAPGQATGFDVTYNNPRF